MIGCIEICVQFIYIHQTLRFDNKPVEGQQLVARVERGVAMLLGIKINRFDQCDIIKMSNSLVYANNHIFKIFGIKSCTWVIEKNLLRRVELEVLVHLHGGGRAPQTPAGVVLPSVVVHPAHLLHLSPPTPGDTQSRCRHRRDRAGNTAHNHLRYVLRPQSTTIRDGSNPERRRG